MATHEFVLQGLTDKNHLDSIQKLYEVPDYQDAIFSIAYISLAGVGHIEEYIAPRAATTTIYAGIRNEITSYQALEKLRDIGAKLYIVDTGPGSVTFHPKLYLSRGAAHARLLVGSANLTAGGLNNNIEASVFLDYDFATQADRDFIVSVCEQFDGIIRDYPEHVSLVPDQAYLKALLDSGRVIDEDEVRPPSTSRRKPKAGHEQPVPRIRLKRPPLRVRQDTNTEPEDTTPPAPPAPPPSPPNPPAPTPPTPPAPPQTAWQLVWRSKDLAQRDLNIPDADGTHKTGSINLDKGRLAANVDHRHYFRDQVFDGLNWTPRSATVDETAANFELSVRGAEKGVFWLPIRHTHITTSKAYLQKNAMTRLSWAAASGHVGLQANMGLTMHLYRDSANHARFRIEIR